MASPLEGVRVLVTGAGDGIGRAIALRFAKDRSRVGVADIRGDRAVQTAALISETGGEARAITADVTIQADVDRMVDEVVDAFGGLDVLVNNAGVTSGGFIESVSDEEIERVLNVNLIGVIRVTRAAVPYLKDGKRGRIINISSVEGLRGSGLLPLYGSSKAGVIGLTHANAVELARNGITVNAICPGPIQTELLAPLIAHEESRKKLLKAVPMRRLGLPEDVAGAVAFFASEEASFITGNELVIDGGLTIKT